MPGHDSATKRSGFLCPLPPTYKKTQASWLSPTAATAAGAVNTAPMSEEDKKCAPPPRTFFLFSLPRVYSFLGLFFPALALLPKGTTRGSSLSRRAPPSTRAAWRRRPGLLRGPSPTPRASSRPFSSTSPIARPTAGCWPFPHSRIRCGSLGHTPTPAAGKGAAVWSTRPHYAEIRPDLNLDPISNLCHC